MASNVVSVIRRGLRKNSGGAPHSTLIPAGALEAHDQRRDQHKKFPPMIAAAALRILGGEADRAAVRNDNGRLELKVSNQSGSNRGTKNAEMCGKYCLNRPLAAKLWRRPVDAVALRL